MKSFCKTLLIVLFSSALSAQNIKIDSLKIKLTQKLDPKVEAVLNIEIGYEFLTSQVFFDSAYYYTEKALHIARENNLPELEAKSLFNLGKINISTSNFTQAKEYFYESTILFEKAQNSYALGFAFNNLGASYFEIGDYDNAIKYYNKSLAISTEEKDYLSIAICNMNLGEAYYKKGNLNKSKSLLENSLATLDSINVDPPTVHLFYARTLFSLNQINIAKEQAFISYSIAKKENNLFYVSEASNLLATIYHQEKDFENAYNFQQIYWEKKDSLNNAKELNEIEKLKLNYELEKKDKELNYIKQKEKYRVIIYFLVGLGVLLLSVLVTRYLKISKMTKEIHDIQKRLIEKELNEREINKKMKNATAFEATREQDKEN